MCGIAGQVRFDGRPVDPDLLRRMADALAHRGPDGEGMWQQDGVGLVHRRLAIIDLSVGGRQPMHRPEDDCRIVFNGEIYNYQHLAEGLSARGQPLRSRSDTEVLLHRYAEVGPDVVQDLRGMFAFAIWDPRRQRLVLARDRIGKKPLYLHVSGDRLTFASELSALLCEPSIERRVDPVALDHFLTYQYVPSDRSALAGISRLPPAHVAVFDRTGLSSRRYWRLSYRPKVVVTDESLVAHELRTLLTEAVRLRMISDVPLGAFLSGGVDSSAVVAAMSRQSDRPVKTFSIGFEEEDFSELPHARQVAQAFGTDHHEFIVRPDAVEVLPALVRHYGEPYADSSALATWYVARETRRHVTVALNGDGGDESFAGYERYVAHKLIALYRRVPAAARRAVLAAVSALPESFERASVLRRARRFAEAAQGDGEQAYLRLVACLERPLRHGLYTEAFRRSLEGYDAGGWLDRVAADTDAVDPTDRCMAVDVETYLPDDLMVKVDIATMCHGLEGRSPFLDHVLMEYAARLPAQLKLSGRTTKYILKKSLEPWLPASLLHRPKMGFGVPIKKWFRGPLVGMLRAVLLDPAARARGILQPGAVEAMIDEHVQGRRDQAYRLWTLLMLELWMREFIDRRSAIL